VKPSALAIACLSCGLLNLVQESKPARAPSKAPRIESSSAIGAYCGQIEKEQNARARDHFYGRIDRDEEDVGAPLPIWREYKSDQDLDTDKGENIGFSAALVWTRSGRVIAANLTTQVGSGDWVLYATYCFRADGSLARIQSTLDTFHGHVTAEREWLFSSNGKQLQSAESFKDLKSQVPKKPDDSYFDVPTPVYLRDSKLPFASLLKNNSKR